MLFLLQLNWDFLHRTFRNLSLNPVFDLISPITFSLFSVISVEENRLIQMINILTRVAGLELSGGKLRVSGCSQDHISQALSSGLRSSCGPQHKIVKLLLPGNISYTQVSQIPPITKLIITESCVTYSHGTITKSRGTIWPDTVQPCQSELGSVTSWIQQTAMKTNFEMFISSVLSGHICKHHLKLSLCRWVPVTSECCCVVEDVTTLTTAVSQRPITQNR